MVQELLKRLNENKKKFKELNFSGKSWQGDWTKNLKQIVYDLGKEHHFDTAANGIQDDNGGEYLFDVVWYEMYKDKFYHIQNNIAVDDKKIHLMKSVKMALESEISQMSFGGLKVDFDKLFASNAEYKVFVTIKKKVDDPVFQDFMNYARMAVQCMEGTEKVYVIYWREYIIEDDKINHFDMEVIDFKLIVNKG